MKSGVWAATALLVTLAASPLTLAQEGFSKADQQFGFGSVNARKGNGAPPPPAQKAAPIDLTGYWVSVIFEDWRWRMLTPPHGDYESVPLNAAGKQLADTFDAAKYGAPWSARIDCRAYYAGGLMRMPTRVHISWADPNTLKIETDWGQQTRMLYFNKSQMPATGPTPQGSSFAQWQSPSAGGGDLGFGAGIGVPAPTAASPSAGKLHVVTDHLLPGWLRRNGVPYGAKTHLTEWFHAFPDSTGTQWFDVATTVDDPEYLSTPFVTSSDFRREPDGSRWAPHPCVKD